MRKFERRGKMKYKEGDRVVVSTNFGRGSIVTDEMLALSGSIVTIHDVGGFRSGRCVYHIQEDGGRHLWEEDMFLPHDTLCDVSEEESGSNLQTFEARSMKRKNICCPSCLLPFRRQNRS